MFMIIAATVVGCTNEQKTETTNPLLLTYDTPFNVPPFDKIKDEHFKPAFDEALKQHKLEIDSIVNNTGEPTFANTILALENAGGLLRQVSTIFSNLNLANTNDTIQALAKSMAPVLSAHNDEITLNSTLFGKIKTIWEKKQTLGLDA